MQKRIQLLISAAYNYYRLGKSIMSDSEYDILYEEVKQWEIDNNIEDKLTEKVCLGYFEGDSTVKVKHKYPMISIEKDNSRTITSPSIITPKLDGVALELEYVNGHLYRKLTRGDGEYGSDVTKIIISNIPKQLSVNKSVVIRGEVMCPSFEDFGKVHRNVVAGSLGKVDFTEDRHLTFIAYWTSLELETYEQELHWLKQEAFSVVPYLLVTRVLNICKDLIPVNYATDGYVLRENSNKNKNIKTAHHYKNQWAYKFAAETATTLILGVDWKKSKNGYFSPVAELAPVTLDGTTVSRVTLNNLDYIAERDICIGDTVLVHKAKEIIPEIKTVLKRPKDRKPILLLFCPDCGSELEMQGVRLTCTNKDCCKDLALQHFCKTIGIKGLGLKSIEKLNINHPLDLYELTLTTLTNKLGKNGEKVYQQIQDSKKVNVVKLLCALNIPSIKKTMLTKIFNKYPNIEVLQDYEKLISIDGVGEKTANIIIKWYSDKAVLLIPLFEELGFNLTPNPVSETALLVAVTGKLPMSRKEFTSMMIPKGVNVQSITKNTKLLITGEKPGKANLTKADKYGISIVPYHTFIKDLTSN